MQKLKVATTPYSTPMPAVGNVLNSGAKIRPSPTNPTMAATTCGSGGGDG